jgi:teichuronic acid biosynthesis glycosyltransferase TuaC
MRSRGAEVDTFTFPLGPKAYVQAAVRLRRLLAGRSFDVVHAHYGLCGWVAALAGARPLVVTFHGTDVRHRVVGPISRWVARRADLAAAASRSQFGREGSRPGLPLPGGRAAVLPCGVDTARFRPSPRREARGRLGLDPDGRYLLLPADPARPVKRHDRAIEVARLAGAELLTTAEVEPERMPDWVNAAAAVLVTSDNEGFGLAVLEALACDVPVLSTPVGISPLALEGLDGCLVAPFDAAAWAAVAGAHLDAGDPRIAGRASAEMFSSQRMADRVLVAYEGLVSK